MERQTLITLRGNNATLAPILAAVVGAVAMSLFEASVPAAAVVAVGTAIGAASGFFTARIQRDLGDSEP